MSGNGRVFYWDSCIYLAWLKQEVAWKDYLSSLDDMMLRSRENKIVILTSTITLLEVMDTGLTADQNKAFTDLFGWEIHKAIDVDIQIAMKARSYRSHYKSRGERFPAFPDSIHLATAFSQGAHEMHTFDDGKKGKPEERFSPLAHSGNIAGDALTIVRPPKLTPAPPVLETPDMFPEGRAISFED